MSKYMVVDAAGVEVEVGDVITDFRGSTAIFMGVSRGPEYNGTAKVRVAGAFDREFYAQVFALTVTPV